MIFAKLMFLPMMLKVLDRTQRPFTCAFLYALLLLTNGLIFNLAAGGGWLHSVALPFVQALAEAGTLFYLLVQLEGTGLYWAALIVGGLLLLIF